MTTDIPDPVTTARTALVEREKAAHIAMITHKEFCPARARGDACGTCTELTAAWRCALREAAGGQITTAPPSR